MRWSKENCWFGFLCTSLCVSGISSCHSSAGSVWRGADNYCSSVEFGCRCFTLHLRVCLLSNQGEPGLPGPGGLVGPLGPKVSTFSPPDVLTWLQGLDFLPLRRSICDGQHWCWVMRPGWCFWKHAVVEGCVQTECESGCRQLGLHWLHVCMWQLRHRLISSRFIPLVSLLFPLALFCEQIYKDLWYTVCALTHMKSWLHILSEHAFKYHCTVWCRVKISFKIVIQHAEILRWVFLSFLSWDCALQCFTPQVNLNERSSRLDAWLHRPWVCEMLNCFLFFFVSVFFYIRTTNRKWASSYLKVKQTICQSTVFSMWGIKALCKTIKQTCLHVKSCSKSENTLDLCQLMELTLLLEPRLHT